ncbi:hypothetical protein T02_8685 [Trichinella nativa]|uniref:Uncharacterized protein n=1 Tax=Trichinella nativa TaxID=6335 RepID=A0A0V1LLT1_9BILA|nr:hypothetical protein T02_8685 [Trichinella nativa]
MEKGGHSSSHSHSSTRSNSGGRNGHSHSSEGGKSEETGEKPTQTKSGSDANRPLSKSPIRSDTSISSKGRCERGGKSEVSSNASQVQHSSSKRDDSGHLNDASHLARNQKGKVTATVTSIKSVFKLLDQYSQDQSKERTDTSHRSESRNSESGRDRRRNKRRRIHWISILKIIPQTEVMNPTGRKVEEEETERGESEEEEEEDQLQPEANLLSVHSTMILIIIPQTKMMQPDVGRKVKAVKVEEVGEEEIDEECGGHCELFTCSCHPGIYCEDCFRTLRRSFRDKFECSLSKRNVLMLPDDGKVYLLSPSGRSMFQRLYVQVKSPYDASTFCKAAKYPSERFNFSGRDEEISRKLLKKLHFKHHRTRKGRRNPKSGRGT